MNRVFRYLSILLCIVLVLGSIPVLADNENGSESTGGGQVEVTATAEPNPTESSEEEKVTTVDVEPTETSQTTTPAETTPAETTPAETTPAETTPAETTPAETTPAETTPAETTPAETTPAENTPAETTPAETTPAETTPAETTPAETTPAETTPAEPDPTPAPAPAVAFTNSSVVVDITDTAAGFDPAAMFGLNVSNTEAKDVVWTTSDPAIASIENGVLKVMNYGTVTVRAALAADADVFAEATLTIDVGLVITGAPEVVEEDMTFTLSVTRKDGTPVSASELTWSSSDENVAAVDANGVVSTKLMGETDIKAVWNGYEAVYSMNVVLRVVPINATFEPIYSNSNGGAIVVSTVDTTEVLDYSRIKFTPEYGYQRYFDIDENGYITPVTQDGMWTTDANGNLVYITMKGILANGKDKVEIDVAVEYRGSIVTIPVVIKQAAVGAYSRYGLLEVHVGETMNLNDAISLAPNPNSDSIVSMRSSDETLFTVSPDYVLTPLREGKGYIVITTAAGVVINMPVSCPLLTTELELIAPKGNLRIGESADIELIRYPAESDDVVKWTSSNKEIATVDQNGHVEFINPGEVTITVTVLSTGLSDSVKLKVIRPVQGFTLYKGIFPNKTSFVIAEGKTLTPVIAVSPSNASNTGYYMVSSNPSVLSVYNNGKSVKGVKAGYATVTVYSSDGEASMELDFTVPYKKYALTSFKLSASSVTIYEGASKTVKATVNSKAYDKTVEWMSTDPNVATVENGKIVGVNPGKCTVYAINSAGGYKSVKVTVNMRVPTKVSLNVTKGSMYVGSEYQFTATITPANLPREEATKLTWKTSNKNVVIVNEEGKIFAISPGTATITVTTVNGKKATCKVTVKPYKVTSVQITHPYTEFIVGGTYDLDVIVGPENATNQAVTWSTSSSSRVSIDKNTGVIKCKKTGTVTITAKAKDGSGKKHSIKINVVKLPIKSSSVTIDGIEVVAGNTYELTYKSTMNVDVTTDPVMYVDYATSDSRVASIDQNGLITATGCGTAKITVTAGGQYKRSFYINVPYAEDAPRYRALVISQYTNSSSVGYLPFSTNSTNGIINALSLSDLEGSRYDVTYKKEFTTPAQVISSINSTFADAKEGDVSVIYIITHGNLNNGQFRWHLKGSGSKSVWLYPSDVMNALANIHGDVVLVVLSCYSGGDVEQEGTLQNMISQLDNGAGVGSSYSVITSTDGTTRSSYANTAASFSYDFFTYGLCMSLGWDMTTSTEAATNADADGDGIITLKELAKATQVITKEECERFVDEYGTSAYWGPTTTEKTQNVQYYLSDKANDLAMFSKVY